MSKNSNKIHVNTHFRSNFNFGGLMAESDPLLVDAYWDNGDFDVISSPKDKDPRCIIVGRTGSGKSAAFQHLERLYQGKVIRILPENLSLPYITNLNIMRQLPGLGVHLEPLFVALWKHVILVEVIKHRYHITTPEQKLNILTALRDRLKLDRSKTKALDYLDAFGDKFWCETDERVQQIADTVERRFAASGGIDGSIQNVGGIKAASNIEQAHTREARQELVAKYQKIVNETQLPRLNEMIVILNDEILDSEQHFTYLVIDDLDKEWVDQPFVNLLIRCLFQAVVDMQRVKYLKILVALRTNLFEQIGYSQQSPGGQEEKFRGLALSLRWTESDLRQLLDHRAEAAFRFHSVDASSLLQVLPKKGRANRADDPISYILSRTLLRPRDAILFLNECARNATGKNVVSWKDIFQAEKSYSLGRLKALSDEWKNPYIDIHRVFDLFRRHAHKFDRDDFTAVLEEIALLLADSNFRGKEWLHPIFERVWAPGNMKRAWHELWGEITKLLYDISFIGIARGLHKKVSYSYQEPGLAQYADNLTENIYIEIHPAFQRALETREFAIAA